MSNYQTDLGAEWLNKATTTAKAMVPTVQQPKATLWQKMHTPTLRGVGGLTAAYHGYKRNKSIGWAIGWSLLGGLSPLLTNVIAVAQGFGKPKKGK